MATANEKKAQFQAVRDEARTVGAQLVVQAQGNVGAARQIAGEAHAWLCDVDPSFVRAELVQLPAVAATIGDAIDGAAPAFDAAAVGAADLERWRSECAMLQTDRDFWRAEAESVLADRDSLQIALERSEAECERRGNAGATDRERLADAREKLTAAAEVIAKLEAKNAALLKAYEDKEREAGSLRIARGDTTVAPAAAPAPRVAPAAAYDAAMRAPAAVAPAVDGGPVRPSSVDAAKWEAMSPAMRAFIAKSAK